MLVDLGLAAASFGVLWTFGLLFMRLIAPGHASGSEYRIFHAAPFVGCALIILTSQTLFYLHIPVAQSVFFLWIAAASAGIYVTFGRRLTPWRSPEWPLLAVLIGVFAVQGLGLLMLGSDVYVGSGWHDMYNYVSTAELIADYPYATHLSDIAGHPYLFAGVEKQTDRIGQSVLQAFYMKSLGISGKSAFQFVSLLGPVLTTIAVSWLCRELGLKRNIALLAAAIAGTMPSITLTHLESYLSQGLGTPFLLAWPMMLAAAVRPQTGNSRASFSWMLFAGLTAAAGWSIYTEYLPLYLGAWLVFVVVELLRRLSMPSSEPSLSIAWTVGASVIALALAFLLDPFYFPNILPLLSGRAAVGNALDGLFPWSGKITGITHLWLGSLASAKPPVRTIIDTVSMLLFALGIGGLVVYAARTRNSLAAAASALLAAPWAIAALLGWKFGYPHYKILVSVSPLLPVGLACFDRAIPSIQPTIAKWEGPLARTALVIALGFSLSGTLNFTFRAGGGAGLTSDAMGRGGSFKLVDPAMRDIQRQLTARAGQTVYIAWFDNFFAGNYVNAWLVYFARFNTVYTLNPRVNDADITQGQGFDLAIPAPNSDFVVVASTRYPELESYLRSGNSPFHVYELPREAWPGLRQHFVTQMPDKKRWP